MTEKELIQKLQTLKQVKPRQDWVLLTKNQILSSSERKPVVKRMSVAGFIGILFQRKFAYAFAVFLFLFVGLSGIVSFLPSDAPGQQTPTTANAIKSDVETFKIKSQNLATVAQSQPDALPEAIKDVKKEAKSLTAKIQKDPSLAKEVALDISNNRTYLDVVGSERIEETDDLYGAVVDSLLAESKNISWTEDQEETLVNIEELREAGKKGEQGKNLRALEEYLLLSAGVAENNEEPTTEESLQDDENPENNETIENNESLGEEAENNSL